MRGIWKQGFPLLLSMVLLVIAFYTVEKSDVVERLQSVDLGWFLGALLFCLPLFVLMSIRWWLVCQKMNIPLEKSRAWSELYASACLNRLLPIPYAGDFGRGFRLERDLKKEGVSLSGERAARSVILERLSNQLGVGVLLVFATLYLMIDGYADLGGVLWRGGAAFVVLMFVGYLCRVLFVQGPLWKRSVQDFQAVFGRKEIATQWLLSILIALNVVLVFILAARAAHVDLPMDLLFAIAALVIALSSLPLGFAGWGLREISAAFLFAMVGGARVDGVSAGIVYGIVCTLASLPGVLVFCVPRIKIIFSDIQYSAIFNAVIVLGTALATCLSGDIVYVLAGGLLYLGGLVGSHWGGWIPTGGVGVANGLTLFRVCAISVMAYCFEAIPSHLFAIACFGLYVLDGCDGFIARKMGQESTFGAEFDKETDALTIMLLASLLTIHGRVGAWVMIAGCWRYAYLLFVSWLPRVAAAPRSQLARWFYALLILSLIASFLGSPWTTELAALGTVAVSISFCRSIVWTFIRFFEISNRQVAKGAM